MAEDRKDASKVSSKAAATGLEGKMIGGRYRIRHQLGLGGSATVYEAEDTSFGRLVALKIPHDNVGPNSVPAKRLLREARASGAVGHPNVCQVSEIGTMPSGSPFVVMERLVGDTLRDRITQEGRLPVGDLVDVMMQILSGLGAAHERGIIHRDIKPENIFLSRRSGCPALVKILDFGLVSTDAPMREELTQAGMVVGTPYYLAPEQVRGVRDFDPRVDLYACGVVLYEAATGRRPFTASNVAGLFREILAASPVPLSDLRRDAPPALGEVIRRAMSPSPQTRYANVSEFQHSLSRVTTDPPTPASFMPFKAAKQSAKLDGPLPAFDIPLDETRVEGPAVVFEVTEDEEWEQVTLKKPAPRPPPVPKKRP